MNKKARKLKKALLDFHAELAKTDRPEAQLKAWGQVFSLVVGVCQREGFSLDNQIELLVEAKTYFDKLANMKRLNVQGESVPIRLLPPPAA